ncbi:MAG: molybdate ABC transporter substrate-binding protein [Firmicutes bacterium]|nr:molybdate ABC transporter substrate-binding protein [Bacillota bacterium]
MKVKKFLIFFIALILIFALIIALEIHMKKTSRSSAMLISAAANFSTVLPEIAELYKKSNPEAQINFNFASSGILEKQIEYGATADLFISASAKEMDKLQGKMLIDTASRKNLVKNRLVLVVPADSNIAGNDSNTLLDASIKKIAVGDFKAVPAGEYAEEVLSYYKVEKELEGKLIFCENVKQVLKNVELGTADAGFVYESDAMTSKKVKVLWVTPDESHSPIVFPAAVLSGSSKKEEAKKFENFLFSKEAGAVFASHGYIPESAGK